MHVLEPRLTFVSSRAPIATMPVSVLHSRDFLAMTAACYGIDVHEIENYIKKFRYTQICATQYQSTGGGGPGEWNKNKNNNL